MTLKITITVDQENEQGVALIGLLAKAYGRGEAGVIELEFQRDVERRLASELIKHGAEWYAKAQLKKPGKIARLVAAGRKRKAPGLGTRGIKTGKRTGVQVALRAMRLEASLDGLREGFRANKLNTNGVGATLSKLAKRGYCWRVEDGKWRLTDEGVELDKKLNGPTEAERDAAVD